MDYVYFTFYLCLLLIKDFIFTYNVGIIFYHCPWPFNLVESLNKIKVFTRRHVERLCHFIFFFSICHMLIYVLISVKLCTMVRIKTTDLLLIKGFYLYTNFFRRAYYALKINILYSKIWDIYFEKNVCKHNTLLHFGHIIL